MEQFDASSADRLHSWQGVPPSIPVVPPWRRRVAAFVLSFLLFAVVSLAVNFLRPAEYRATARVQLVYPGQGDSAEERRDAAGAAFLAEVQVLTSRPLVEQALAQLRASGDPAAERLPGSPEAVQQMVEAVPVAGSTVVELTASGRAAEALAPLLNALIGRYREQLGARYQSATVDQSAHAQDEADALAARVAEKRTAVDAFRARHDIVSLERDENQVLSRVKGLGASLSTADSRVAAAEARLRTVRDSIAAGRTVASRRDNATLLNLEQRASELHEEMRELERHYTPDFLAFDPRAKAIRARIADIENQMGQVRKSAQQAVLTEAEEELASALAESERLKARASADRRDVQAFTARLGEFKAMQEELVSLETMHQAAVVKATGLVSGQQVRAPSVTTLEEAVPPGEVWRPQYVRDAGLALTGSLVLALFLTWIVELFSRTPSGPTVVVAPAWIQGLPPGERRVAGLSHRPAPTLLPGSAPLPRLLPDGDVARLLAELPGEFRVVGVALLSGLTVDETLTLRRAAVDPAARHIVLPDRSLPLSPALEEALRPYLARESDDAGAPLLKAGSGADISAGDIDATILYAAHDAGIEGANEITAASLRHSYIVHLLQQGIRFADLVHVVGRMPAEVGAAYAALVPAGGKHAIGDVDLVHPALRHTPAAPTDRSGE